MKLKSSSRFTIVFLAGLILVTALLAMSQIEDKKEDKYPSAPSKIEQATTLDFVQITVSEKSYKKLKKKRDKAVSVGILETNDKDYVPATITFNGQQYNAEIRLKGDWTTHLEGSKWSFRVKLKNDKTIMGMRKFSLHHPAARNYLGEWLYHKAIKKEGLMGLRYNFVEGKLHVKSGKNKYINIDTGIYAIEETFDKRTIESNKRKESVILKFSEDYWWNEVKKSKVAANKYGLKYSDLMNYDIVTTAKMPISVFSEGNILKDSVLGHYFKLSKNLLEDLMQNKNNISDVFDVKKLAMDNALTNLFGAEHGTYLINIRYYYNPITSKLEPVAFDGNSGIKLKNYIPFNFKGKTRDSVYLKHLAFALQKVSQPEYIENLLLENKSELEDLQKALKTEFKNRLIYPKNLEYNQGIIYQELENLKNEFNIEGIEIKKREPASNLKPVINNLKTWELKNVTLAKNKQKYKNDEIYLIKRSDDDAPAFIRKSSISINNGGEHEISIVAKKASGDVLGFRIQGVYPNRVDALFNLETGKVIDTFKQGYFEGFNPSIEPLGAGWYKCTMKVKINTNKVSVIFGTTLKEKQVSGWEGALSNTGDVFIVPKTLTINESK
ncbi:hypothetical protein [Winogradskyella sp. 3972H.M.0a.05]|uniref:phage head spike fiber domain-containing protein n=1 Tax=Winogradskyella sp. 3972H.M.0a.05 TaxID=2950277 RepID=UPI003391C3BD